MVQLGPADAICIMTNNGDQEVAAVVAALATRVGFVGAFGHLPMSERAVICALSRRPRTTH